MKFEAGVTVELYATLAVMGTANFAGTPTSHINLKTSPYAGGSINTTLRGGTLLADYVDSNNVSIAAPCGSVMVNNSSFGSISAKADGLVLSKEQGSVCEASQKELTVRDSRINSVDITSWVSSIVLENNDIANNVDILHNRGVDAWAAQSSGRAVVTDNEIHGRNGFSYMDDCKVMCASMPLSLVGNELTEQNAKFQVLWANLSNGSLANNSGPNPELYEFWDITVLGSLNWPIGSIDESPELMRVAPEATLVVRAGYDFVAQNLSVAGAFRFEGGAANKGVYRGENREGAATYGSISVGPSAKVDFTNVEFRALRDIRVEGELSILDSTFVEPTGVPNDYKSSMYFKNDPAVIHQVGGSIYLDADYVRTPRLLTQYEGTAIIRGHFIEPRADINLIQTCEWEVDQCFVDARDVDWSDSDGPFPAAANADPLAEPPTARFCGAGVVWPWIGSDESDSGQWIGGCDGVDYSPYVAIEEARDRYDASLAGFRAMCAEDATYFAEACTVVEDSQRCYNAAMELAQESSTFPLEPDVEDVATETAAGAVKALETLDRPSLRLPVAGVGLALTAHQITSTVLNVRDAYSQCTP